MNRIIISLAGAGALCMAAGVGAQESDLEARLAAAEARLAGLERQQLDSAEMDIRTSGFVTFGMERTSQLRDENDNEVSYRGADRDWSSRRLTRAGLQWDARVNDRADAVIQLLARGDEEFDVEMRWAYVGYELTPSVKMRAGRLVLPFYMHSQYTQVGYALPWIELPAEAYGVVPVETMEGIDLTWRVATGEISHSVNVFWGSMDVPSAGLVFEADDQMGLNLRSNWRDWGLWLAASTAETTVDLSGQVVPLPGPPMGPGPVSLASESLDGERANYYSAGFQYDNGRTLVMGEINELTLNSPGDWFPEFQAAYLTAGYRIGAFMPHLTWATVDSGGVDDACEAGPVAASCLLFGQFATRQKSWTLGVRYDVSPGVALKAEASRYHDFRSGDLETSGFFSAPPVNDDPAVFRLSVDAVF